MQQNLELKKNVWADSENWTDDCKAINDYAFYMLRDDGDADWFCNLGFSDDGAVLDTGEFDEMAIRVAQTMTKMVGAIFIQRFEDPNEVVQGCLELMGDDGLYSSQREDFR